MLSNKAIIQYLNQSNEGLSTSRQQSAQFSAKEVEILIVDDSPSVWKMVEHLSSKVPYRITLATDGFAAVLEVIKRILINPKQLPFHIIFMDQHMPRLTGEKAIVEIARYLNEAGFNLKDIPIISISSFDFTPSQLAAMGIIERMPDKKITAVNITHMVEKHVFKNAVETPIDSEVAPIIRRVKSSNIAVRKVSLSTRLPRCHSYEHLAAKEPPLRMPHRL